MEYLNYSDCIKYYKYYNRRFRSINEYILFNSSVDSYTKYLNHEYSIINKSKRIFHNIKGSAFIWFDHNGIRVSEYYYINGALHNTKGPAKIFYDNGKIVDESYWLDGIQFANRSYINYYVNGTKYYPKWN